MRILKNIGIALFALITILYTLDTFLPDPKGGVGVTQKVTFGGKTVHLAQKGDGPLSYTTETADGTLVVNGQKLDLSGGDVFTVVFSTDGTFEVKKGAP